MFMCNNTFYLEQFANLVRLRRLQQDKSVSGAWKTERIPSLAQFVLHLLSKSFLKDAIEFEDLQKRKGGTQSFRGGNSSMKYDPAANTETSFDALSME